MEANSNEDILAEWRAADNGIPQLLAACHISIFLSTTDAGADEVGTRAGFHLATASNVFSLFFDSDCFEHQNHIINHDVLVDMDDILKLFALLGRNAESATATVVARKAPDKYYSTVAKIMHNWRSHAPSDFRLARVKFNDQTAVKHFK